MLLTFKIRKPPDNLIKKTRSKGQIAISGQGQTCDHTTCACIIEVTHRLY